MVPTGHARAVGPAPPLCGATARLQPQACLFPRPGSGTRRARYSVPPSNKNACTRLGGGGAAVLILIPSPPAGAPQCARPSTGARPVVCAGPSRATWLPGLTRPDFSGAAQAASLPLCLRRRRAPGGRQGGREGGGGDATPDRPPAIAFYLPASGPGDAPFVLLALRGRRRRMLDAAWAAAAAARRHQPPRARPRITQMHFFPRASTLPGANKKTLRGARAPPARAAARAVSCEQPRPYAGGLPLQQASVRF